MEIVLVRQGKPRLEKLTLVNGVGFCGWINAYDAAPVCSRVIPPAGAIEIVEAMK